MTVAFNLSQLANYVNSSGKLDAANGLVNAISVPNGGTGAASATAYAVQCGGTTSTSAHQSIATVGTSGQVLTSIGAGALPTFQSGSSGQLSYNLYTSGTTTWTAPTGVTKAKVICIGGGGGGGRFYADEDGGTGGFGGISIGIYTVTPGTGYSAVVGAGGAGSTSGNGSSGGSSSFGSFLSATGGNGGIQGGAGGSSGVGSNGTTANTYIQYGGGGDFVGAYVRPRAASSTAGETWTAASGRLPGSLGDGGSSGGGANDPVGGVGGVVYIVYVG